MAEARCPKCSKPVLRSQTTCPHCSAELPAGTAPCPHCKMLVPLEAKVCPFCNRGMAGRALMESTAISPDEQARISAAVTGSHPETKQCPYCAETIKWEANVCRYCQRDLVGARAGAVAVVAPATPKWNRGIAALLSLIIPGAGQMYKGQVGTGLVWFLAVIVGYFMFILPGLALHLLCILTAASGDPMK